MKYLVIGSEGFLGKAICKELNAEKKSFLIKVDCIMPSPENTQTHCYKIDIRETEKLLTLCSDEHIDVVFNLAGTFSASSKEELFQINCFAPIAFLEAAGSRRFKLVLVGSAAEYGIVPHGVKAKEIFSLFPVTEYGMSKACQTMMASRLSRKNSFPEVIIARPFNIIGPGISDQLFLGAFAKQIASIEKGLKQPILEVGNIESYRDIVPVNKLAHIFKILAECGKHKEIYNVCSGKPRKIGEILDRLLSLSKANIKIKVKTEKFKSDDIPWSLGDNAKISKLEPIAISDNDLHKSLKETLNWYREKIIV